MKRHLFILLSLVLLFAPPTATWAISSVLTATRTGIHRNGLMAPRFACINGLPIQVSERNLCWPSSCCLDEHPGLSQLEL